MSSLCAPGATSHRSSREDMAVLRLLDLKLGHLELVLLLALEFEGIELGELDPFI